MMTRILMALALLASTLEASANTITISGSPGGRIDEFEQHFRADVAAGNDFRIDGMCASACTMVIGIAAGRVCATPNAFFGFHTAYELPYGPQGPHVYSASSTRQMTQYYSPPVWAWLKSHGGLKPAIKWMRAPDIYSVVPPCA